jgi:hypothetical protein
MKENDNLQVEILYSLRRTGHIGSKHTPIANVCRRLSKHDCKSVTKEIGNLIKKEFILIYNTHHDKDIRLNPKKMKLIKEITKKKWDSLKTI